MAPVSALAKQKVKIASSKVAETKVTEAASKDIMADLLGELDREDADELQLNDVNQMAAANAAMFATNGVVTTDAEPAAFNMEDNLNQRYNMSVGAIKGTNKFDGNPGASEGPKEGDGEGQKPEQEANASASKKRHFNDITQISLSSIPQRRSNPFAKSAQSSRPSAAEPEQINSSTGV